LVEPHTLPRRARNPPATRKHAEMEQGKWLEQAGPGRLLPGVVRADYSSVPLRRVPGSHAPYIHHVRMSTLRGISKAAGGVWSGSTALNASLWLAEKGTVALEMLVGPASRRPSGSK
jgi:hypothetical protein